MHRRHLACSLQLLAFARGVVDVSGDALNEEMSADVFELVCVKHPWPPIEVAERAVAEMYDEKYVEMTVEQQATQVD